MLVGGHSIIILKWHEPVCLPITYCLIVGWIGFFNLNKATNLGERKLRIRISCILFKKIDLVSQTAIKVMSFRRLVLWFQFYDRYSHNSVCCRAYSTRVPRSKRWESRHYLHVQQFGFNIFLMFMLKDFSNTFSHLFGKINFLKNPTYHNFIFRQNACH